MTKVHILKPEIISKIAAGEVIERPASVIKELVENALDAGTDSIEVQLKDAGKSLIRIKDTGHGIEQDDLETIFQRHATSKIAEADDLYNIHSLGFRGEALYSVAAIAHVTVNSKPKTQDSGWEISLRGGQDIQTKPCRFNGHGTDIHIRELFFNTPARKKFLKSNTTEIHQIIKTFIPYTLLYPDVRFTLTHGNKSLINTPAAKDKKKRMAEILNLNADHLIRVEHGFPEENIHVELILGDINLKRTRRDMQFIFVNNRPVQNKAIGFHMNQIYRLIMPPSVYPYFAVYITVAADTVDVNIHPSKREIKIKNEQNICSFLRSMSEQALMTAGPIKQADDRRAHNDPPPNHPIDYALKKSHGPDSTFDHNTDGAAEETGGSTGNYAYPQSSWNRQDSFIRERQEMFIPEDSPLHSKKENLQDQLGRASYVGIFMNKFLLFELNESLLVIDQHAAAERITYEQLIRQMEKGTLEVQHLLSPILIKLMPVEMTIWEEAKDKFEELGLSGSPWDEETLAIHTHPLFIKDIEKTVRHLLDGKDIAAYDHNAMARRACRSSIMAGDKLSPEQADHIRLQLIECLDPFTCPHGRPTVISMNENFLDKQFLRT